MTTWHVEYYDVYEEWSEDKSEAFREAVRDEISRWISAGPPLHYSDHDEELDIYTVATDSLHWPPLVLHRGAPFVWIRRNAHANEGR